MKTKLLLLFIPLLSCCIFLSSCNTNNGYRPDKQILDAFKTRYPKAKKAEWESKQGFYVADFHNDTDETEVWFDKNGKWVLTKTELKYNTLPQAIRNNLEKSDYNNWKRDDITKIERPDTHPIYIIEIQNGGKENDLYYTENGQLVKTINDLRPGSALNYAPLSLDIQNQIRKKYPQAIVIDTDQKKGKHEIDILDRGKTKEVVFKGNNWEATSWEINKTDVPTAVMDAFRKSAYGKYRIDDIHYFETPANNYYYFDLEQDNKDVYLSIDANGNILKEDRKN